jgi:hypothetical protein
MACSSLQFVHKAGLRRFISTSMVTNLANDKQQIDLEISELCNLLADKTMELLRLSNSSRDFERFRDLKQEIKLIQDTIADLRDIRGDQHEVVIKQE